MAGYVFSVSKKGWGHFCAENLTEGFFTPYAVELTSDMTNTKRKVLSKVLAATFGDLVTMAPGDNVYFLSDRKLYGIGVAKQIGEDCKYDNYLNASALLPDDLAAPEEFLTTESPRARWVCFFEPSPHLFLKGVDMDDVLRYRPSAFKSLRAFEGVSFIKIDDEENRALKEFISLANEESYEDLARNTTSFDASVHERLAEMELAPYVLDITQALRHTGNRGYVLSEMFIEASLLQKISRKEVDALGNWDYCTHQLIASPFKPLEYIDKIDVFGYRFSAHYEEEPKLITKYLLVELKKEKINRAALQQTMQYVDWVCNEYASGDYSKIEAYVIGRDAVRDITSIRDEVCQRSFIVESHPAQPQRWSSMALIHYSIDDDDINFSEM